MNYFVRRVTSSIFGLFFGLSVGMINFKPVEAQDTKILNFCEENKSLFHIDRGAKRKVRIAIFDIDIIAPTSIENQYVEEKYIFKGIGNILANELSKDNNFSIVNWNQIKPTKVDSNLRGQSVLVSEDTISLELLRGLRDAYGIEAVLIGNVNHFKANGTRKKTFLGLGTSKENSEVQVQLNFLVIDTTTGEIVLPAEGNGRGNKSYTNVMVPKINVTIGNKTNGDFDLNSGNWTSRTRGSTIELSLNSSDNPETIIESKNENIFNKLLALAAEDAINQVVEKLSSRSNELACLVRKPTLIADAYFDKYSRDIVILNKGRLHGYCEGMTFSIERFPNPVIDPATGRVLRTTGSKIGTVTLTETDAQSSVGIGITEPGQSFRVKDIARLTTDTKCSKNQEQENYSQPSPNSAQSSENE
ncbi:CsgG/HfaB family protein [Rivularia sp. UHCC 0363]|uniref:CsgG/HfaB family protein n=1 Tax=Rivularia sp. UHCC 0363 TaxID=3110244 RepID=UPI002B1EF79F|nr:CsgG/HfaB family protein [Rivularia sp. UHCC 0363]MEA5593075.1 CsgG/HfaB family protein [Rivularia sp. UHCC 0363]